MRILIVNGPNLNLLGHREPDIYGSTSLEEINRSLAQLAAAEGVEVEFVQSNHEGDIIDTLHQAQGRFDWVIINPGALAHYSLALRDAIKAISIPTIEVHLSNIYAREGFRHQSVISDAVVGQITGLGIIGYKLALMAAIRWGKDDFQS
ncbi:MAG: type II 3-dehydroquinate dehydratase [Clostridia bacterium]|nr:type II 3-dehydroquinate dehydratase [Clostridia bacterium]